MAELEKFSALYGKIDYPADLLTTPFEVLEYRTRLGLTTSEFEFICWIFHLVNKDFNEMILQEKYPFTGNRRSEHLS